MNNSDEENEMSEYINRSKRNVTKSVDSKSKTYKSLNKTTNIKPEFSIFRSNLSKEISDFNKINNLNNKKFKKRRKEIIKMNLPVRKYYFFKSSSNELPYEKQKKKITEKNVRNETNSNKNDKFIVEIRIIPELIAEDEIKEKNETNIKKPIYEKDNENKKNMDENIEKNKSYFTKKITFFLYTCLVICFAYVLKKTNDLNFKSQISLGTFQLILIIFFMNILDFLNLFSDEITKNTILFNICLIACFIYILKKNYDEGAFQKTIPANLNYLIIIIFFMNILKNLNFKQY